MQGARCSDAQLCGSARRHQSLQGASLGARLSGIQHRLTVVLVMAQIRQNGESSSIKSVISNQPSVPGASKRFQV